MATRNKTCGSCYQLEAAASTWNLVQERALTPNAQYTIPDSIRSAKTVSIRAPATSAVRRLSLIVLRNFLRCG